MALYILYIVSIFYALIEESTKISYSQVNVYFYSNTTVIKYTILGNRFVKV